MFRLREQRTRGCNLRNRGKILRLITQMGTESSSFELREEHGSRVKTPTFFSKVGSLWASQSLNPQGTPTIDIGIPVVVVVFSEIQIPGIELAGVLLSPRDGDVSLHNAL